MLLLQKQLIDQINNSLVDKKEENGNILLPYKAVYGTPTKRSDPLVDHSQWCVEDTTSIDTGYWNWFLKVRVAEIDKAISMQAPNIHTRICNLDIHRIYLLSNIPIKLGKEIVGLLRAEFSLRFGFKDGLNVPLNLYLSLYDKDCPENCEQDSESIALIPIGKNFISHVHQITSKVCPYYDPTRYEKAQIERMVWHYYQKVRDSYKLFRDDDFPTIVQITKLETLSPKSLTEHLRDLLIKLIRDDNKFNTITKNMI